MAEKTTDVAVLEPESPRASGLSNVRVVGDVVPLLDTGRFEHMQRIASVMGDASLLPDTVRKGKTPREVTANCFLIVEQAVRWSVSPFALAQHAFFVANKMGFEGKVIAAIVNADSRIKGRLEYAYEGQEGGKDRKITVTATFADTGRVTSISGTVAKWATNNENWSKNPDQMLAYRGAREWARRYMPDKLMGVYADDEIEDMAVRARDVTPAKAEPERALPAPKGPPPAPPPKGPPPAPAAKAADAEIVEPTDDQLQRPEHYIAQLSDRLAEADTLDAVDQVWASHLETSDGRLSAADDERCIKLFETNVKRLGGQA